jgi:hypothetical protein
LSVKSKNKEENNVAAKRTLQADTQPQMRAVTFQQAHASPCYPCATMSVAPSQNACLLRSLVRIEGLKNKPELNGLLGTVVAHDSATDRFQVCTGLAQTFSIKPVNLVDVGAERFAALHERAHAEPNRIDDVNTVQKLAQLPMEELLALVANMASSDKKTAKAAVSRVVALSAHGPESDELRPLIACDCASHAALCGLVDTLIVHQTSRTDGSTEPRLGASLTEHSLLAV